MKSIVTLAFLFACLFSFAQPTPPPTISSFRKVGILWHFDVSGQAGAVYRLDSSTDMVNWKPALTNRQLQASTVWTAPISTSPTGFFRFVVPAEYLPPEDRPHLAVKISANSPTYHRLAQGGMASMVAVAYDFRPVGGDSVRLGSLPLRLLSGSPLDITRVSVWHGLVVVGEGTFVGTNASVALDPPVIINKDTDSQLVVRVDTGTGSGNLVVLDLNPTASAVGMNGGVYPILGNTRSVGFRLLKAIPTFAVVPLPDVGVHDGRLLRFRVTAPETGDVSLAQLSFGLLTEGVSIDRVSVTAYTDEACSLPVTGTGRVGSGDCCCNPGGVVVTWADSRGQVPLVIPAGDTLTFEVKWARASFSSPRSQMMTSMVLLEDQSPSEPSLPGQVGWRTIWSPNSGHSRSTLYQADWLSGYGIFGISGVSQVRAGW